MTEAFYLTFAALLCAELSKGLSANGTPPVLQNFSWQLHLARFLWTTIPYIRVALALALVGLLLVMPAESQPAALVGGLVLCLPWAFLYWLFNRFWVGRHKFLPITQKVFAKGADSKIDPQGQVIGVDHNGLRKAYPVNMLAYHHQISDDIGGQPIWITYCALCRSGRVYDLTVDGTAMEFTLVGAITFNAVFRDAATGSWWRQETGEAVKGPHRGKVLQDIPFLQISLADWLAKYPDTEILQHDPLFQARYDMWTRIFNYEASLPGWHMQQTPPLVIGVEAEGQSRAYDFEQLKKEGLVQDVLGSTHLLVLSSEDGTSGFVYDRSLKGDALNFERSGDKLRDTKTKSQWNLLGQCISGDMKGSQLQQIQSYQQFLRAWISFHPQTDFYDFT